MILVTGSTGFIGSHLVEALCGEGEQVRCLIRRSRPASLPAAAETVAGDLLDSSSLARALDGVDAVIHLAGITKALSVEDYYVGNAAGAEALARAAAGRALRFVHVSSLAAAGPSLDGVPLNENSPPHPFTHYGISKLQGEQAVRRVLPDAVIVRPPVVYGPRDTDVFQLLKAISRGLVIEIAGGDRWFSAIYVTDLVAGLIECARHPAARGTYFLAHPEPLTWTGFGAAAARLTGRRPRTVRIPVPIAVAAGACAELWGKMRRKPGIVSRDKIAEARCTWWTCDPARAATELGIVSSTPLEAGLSRSLTWYKEAGWLNI